MHRGVIFTALFIAADIKDTPKMEISPWSPPSGAWKSGWLCSSPTQWCWLGKGLPEHGVALSPNLCWGPGAGCSELAGISQLSLSVLNCKQSWGAWGKAVENQEQ